MTTNRPKCENCYVLSECIFSKVEPNLLEQISENKQIRLYQKGEIIYQTGERPKGIYCIYQGNAKVVNYLDTDQELKLVDLQAGDTLGYRAVIMKRNYQTTAVATQTSLICIINLNAFEMALQSNHAFAIEMMSRLDRDLQQAENRLANLSRRGL